jgi:hypothetical protein
MSIHSHNSPLSPGSAAHSHKTADFDVNDYSDEPISSDCSAGSDSAARPALSQSARAATCPPPRWRGNALMESASELSHGKKKNNNKIILKKNKTKQQQQKKQQQKREFSLFTCIPFASKRR